MREKIIQALQKVTAEKKIHLEVPEREGFGDYSTNIALQVKKEGKNPREIAQEVVSELGKNKDLKGDVEKIEIAGPGFINFWLSKAALLNKLDDIKQKGVEFGKSELLMGNRIMFEYGDANTHKLPHIGHLFSYIYGEAAVRLLDFAGAEMRRVGYQGDIGPHVAKCLWAFRKENPAVPETLKDKVELLQKMYQKGSKAYDEDEKAKEEITEINKAIFNKEEEIFGLWKETRGWCIDYYKEFEKRLDISYDRNYFESEVYEDGKKIVEENIGTVFVKSEGAIIFEGSKYGLHDRVFITKFGTPTYEAKDMYLQKLKMQEWPMDLLIITTAHEQNEYFAVVFKALELLDQVYVGKLKHIGFGMVNLTTGKMSSRTGKIVGGIELVDMTVDSVYEHIKDRKEIGEEDKRKIAETVGLGAIKYTFLKSNYLQNIKFDLKESVSLEGNSGPYLQYTYARTQSVLRKAEETGKTLHDDYGDAELNQDEVSLIRTFIHFPEAVEEAAKNYAPNLLCNYLYDLAQKYNAFYNANKIIGGENAQLRLSLTQASGQILKNGLKLLGIQAPERM